MAQDPGVTSNWYPLRRLGAIALAAWCCAPLVYAATLTPDAAGIGTHTQMGLPSCGFHKATGLPCATCGCTTAFAHAADGSLHLALITQPFGALLALTLAVMAWIAVWSAFTGASLSPVVQVVLSRRVVLCWVIVLLLAWGYKSALAVWGG